MPAISEITRAADAVKLVVSTFESIVQPLFEAAFSGVTSPRDVEQQLWEGLIKVGRELLGLLFSAMCWSQTTTRVAARGESLDQHYVRRDGAGYAQVTTSFGPIVFFWWSFRQQRGGKTSRPAARLFPLHRRVRATGPLMEVAALLASELPFRDAQRALAKVSHGAVTLEDTTLARYAVQAAARIDRRWTYRPRAEIAKILSTRATRDRRTSLPLVYASTDAHALTRYVDESWKAEWKMINGIRVWCVDHESGEIIHLGGEYTWGDCAAVAAIFERLIRDGVLPRHGDYGDRVRAQLVLITDGARWIEERVLPLFPDAIAVLDAWHLVEHLSQFAAEMFGADSDERRATVRTFAAALGLREPATVERKPRKGHRKRRRGEPRPPRPLPAGGSVDALFETLLKALSPRERRKKITLDLATFLENNEYRLDYTNYRKRGIQVGSGAMESMHRFASQVRLKRSGCRWLPETATAILRLRLLARVGRWDEYWSQPDLEHQLAARLAA